MKFFAVIFYYTLIAATMAALTDELMEQLEYTIECIKSSEVDVVVVVKCEKGEFIDDPKYKEFLFCFAKKIGTLNEAGEYQVDVIKAYWGGILGAEKAAKVVEACVGKPAATPQETIFALLKCFYKNCQCRPNHVNAAQS